jgi:lysozyme
VLILAMAAVVLAGLVAWIAVARWHPPADDFPVQGAAVDARNGAVDWFAARTDDVAFAYVLATSGAGERDPMFDRNWRGLFDAGIRRGAIHRFSLCQPAAEQARLFISTVPRTADLLPAMLAIDADPACGAPIDRPAAIASIRSFLALAEAHLGAPMLLAISPAAESGYAISEAIDRPLVGERRLFEPSYLARPWRLWQASDLRRIAGAKGTVRWLVVAP